MPRKSTAAVAEKPASQRKTRAKAAPAPESTPAPTAMEQGDFVRGKNDPSLHGFVASVGRTWLKLQGDKNCKIDEVELVCRLPEQLSDHFKLVGLSREEKLDNLLEPYGFYNLSNWRVAKSDDDSTHFRFLRNKQWEIQFFRSTEVDLLSDGHTWYLALDKHPELKSNGDIEKYCVEAIDHAENIIAQVKEYEDAALAALLEPARFQVGDRVYYVQETNTGVIQELKGDQALVKLFLAASKPIWLGPVGLHPLTPDHITDPNSLQPGEMIKGQSLQGTEYQGKFTGWSMSGMAMLECLDGKKRMLAPATLVRIPVQVEESTEPEQFEEGRCCEGCKHGTVVPCAEGESVSCSLQKFSGAVMVGGVVSASYAKSCSEFEESTPPAESDRVQEETNTLTYAPGFLSAEESSALFEWSQNLDWQQNTMRMYGKETKLPRLEIMFGDEGCNYRYGSVTLKPAPWPAKLQALREKVEAATGFKYQVVIGNLYQDGSHHIGWHSDDSPEMGEDPAIASISLGATRKFDVRNEATKETQSYELNAGDLVFMPAGFQSTHKHRIAKTSKQVGVRINWTFRPYPHSQQVAEPQKGDRLDGLSLTGGYHTGVYIERTTSGLFLIRKEDQTQVSITPDSARILDQLELPPEQSSEPEQPAVFPRELAIKEIRLDGGTQPREGLDRDHIEDLVEALQRGETLPPVGIKYDGQNYWLYSGFHRVEAHCRAGRDLIAVQIEPGTQRDAILAAAGTNTDHGLKRSPATKRRVVAWFLEDPEWRQWSDRQIAEATKTSHVFVGKMRREMPSNLVSFPDKRKFERNGKTYEMAVAPKDPIPTLDELEAMFNQIGTVKRAKKGESFVVESEEIGAPFPIVFKSRLAAWDWWKGHQEQIAKITKPLEPHPQRTEVSPDVAQGLAKMGLQICAPSISPEEFNAEMAKPLPAPKLPKGVCNLTEISGGWRVDGLELAAEVYTKLAAIARQHTKDASLKEAIAFLVHSFELAEQPVDKEVEA